LREWSPRFGVLHHLTRDVALFANYGEGFRPTVQVSGTGAFVFAAQLAKQWEAGAKLALPGQRLQLSAAVFRVENENAISRIGSDAFGNAVFAEVDQSLLGFEADLTAQFSERLALLAHYSFLDAEVSGHPL